ncbi:phytanoyl-CoA dioxygenase family protein, partial [Streptomyces sp. NPDC058307]|uniref:phytanoyl-CoA dioxygenase family protein n=1 Tax=Streptomyces sp. NPDC058307 TaxID=3346439 RepID=UPI0036E4754B
MTVTGIETGLRQFQEDGFMVVRGLFARDEIDRLCGEFTALHSGGPVPGHFEPSAPSESTDPLRRYPRVMQPHEINDLALQVLLDARLREVLETLLGEEVLAAQSMFYFKPPGARV